MQSSYSNNMTLHGVQRGFGSPAAGRQVGGQVGRSFVFPRMNSLPGSYPWNMDFMGMSNVSGRRTVYGQPTMYGQR